MTSTDDRWPRGRSRDGGIDEIPLPGVSGRLWLCGHRVVGPDPGAAMDRVGAHSVLCLCQEHELAERYPAYLAWLRSTGGDRAHWFPIPDLGVPPRSALVDLVEWSIERLAGGDRLVAHCAAGIGRSGTFAAAVLLGLGVGHHDALATVAGHRPAAGPEVGSQADLIAELARHWASRTVPEDR